MTQFIESLQRLYKENKVSNQTLERLLTDKKINKQEYDYIIAAKNAS
jgi:phospholipid N-methyltransferase